MKTSNVLIFNSSEIIRNITQEKYNNILYNPNKPDTIGGFKYKIINNKIFLINPDNNKEYELIPKEQREELIENIYKNPEYIGGYKKIYNIISNRYAGISRGLVQEVIQKKESYQQRIPVRKRKIIKPIITTGVDQIWQMDLIDFQKYAKY